MGDNSSTKRSRAFHRPVPQGQFLNTPDLSENPLNLFTLPYVELIEALADSFFPPNTVVDGSGGTHVLHASAARVDRYILFRAAWEPPFGIEIQLALRDVAAACVARHKKGFVDLSATERRFLLEDLEKEALSSTEWPQARPQDRAFRLIQRALVEGFLGDPGYGGNQNGMGWYYTHFMRYGE